MDQNMLDESFDYNKQKPEKKVAESKNKFTNMVNSQFNDPEVDIDINLDRIRSVNPRMHMEEEEIHNSSSANILIESSKDDPHLNSSRIFSKLRNNNTTLPEEPAMPIIDFGKISSSGNEDKKTPIHSDDEVTPRRGLDEMMSDSKLMELEDW